MALKIVGPAQPSPETPPWEGPVYLPVQQQPGAVQVEKTLCTGHIWNPQTNKCVRCSADRPGVVSEQLEKPKSEEKPAQATPPRPAQAPPASVPAQGTIPSNLKLKVQPAADQSTSVKLVRPPQAKVEPSHTLPSAPPPVRAPGGPYTILDAIKEKSEGRKGTLMLVKEATGEGFMVESVYEVGPSSGHVLLKGANGMIFRPKFGLREVEQYKPVWR